MEERQEEQKSVSPAIAGKGGSNDDDLAQHPAFKRKSKWVRLVFVLIFILVATLPVINGCNGAVKVSSLQIMTLNIPSNAAENEEFRSYVVSGILLLWVTFITILIGVFRITEATRVRPFEISGIILLLYLMIVVAFVFKDQQTAQVVSLDVGWFMMFGVVVLLVYHSRLLKWMLRKVLGKPVSAPSQSSSALSSLRSSLETTVSPVSASGDDLSDVHVAEVQYRAAIQVEDGTQTASVREIPLTDAVKLQVDPQPSSRKFKTWQKALIAFGAVALLAIIIIAVFAYMEYLRQEKAIQLTKDAECASGTWGELAKSDIEENPNKNYQWIAVNLGEKNVYFVQFIDEEGWGRQWETNIEEGTVKWINDDEYLIRKYGLNSVYPDEYELKLNGDGLFSVNIDSDADGGATLRYSLKGEIVNNSGKHVSEAEIEYDVMLIYPERTIHAKNSGSYIVDREVSARAPWNPETSVPISFTTSSLDVAYLRTKPEYFVCQISVFAEDLTGYEFNRCIAEIDLMDQWDSLKKLVADQRDIVKRAEGVFGWQSANAEAKITIRYLYGNMYAVTGEAYYGTQSEFGPNIGYLDFTAELSGGRITHSEVTRDGGSYEIDINILASGITVSEGGTSNDFGTDVSFAGKYQRR